jgi:prepilin-type N-terminal cleavage/methylation domain-containing protein
MRFTDEPRPRARSCAGFSLVEVVVALSVLVVAASIFCQTLLSTSRVRQLNRESTLAADGARVVLEEMRNRPFLAVFRDYNEDPKDDPAGLGTGPGHLFDVEGLEAIDGAPSAGRVFFPSVAVETTVTSGGGGKLFGYGGTSTTTISYHLREDVEDETLGMPRDLDGDNVVDALDHARSYLILPVRVRIEWKSGTSTRWFELVTQLGDFREADR